MLRREVLRSERQRVFRLAGLLTTLLLVTILLQSAAPRLVEALFHGRLSLGTPLAIFPPFIAYELLVGGIFTVLIHRDRGIFTFARYANALVETSMPTVLLFALTRSMEASVAVASWPSLLYFLFIVFSTLRLDFALSAFTGAVAAVELFALAYATLPLAWIADDASLTILYHLSRSAILLLAGFIAGSVGAQLKGRFRRAIDAAAARDRMTNLFGQHVSPPVVERLIAMGTTELSEVRRIAVMFVDIRGFTAAAHRHTPADVVARLNTAFAILVEIVDRRHGIVNKFLGDGFLAMFGAPIDDPEAVQHAVAAGREMLSAMAESNVGNAWPLRIGIAIHVGEAVTGTVGSPRRKEYTVIGDTVNLAARLESLNKEVGSQLIVSAAVRDAAPRETEDATPVGPVVLRGYLEPVTVWRLA
ncbi:MAG TPA: adenylate/guanylate cyclase domain-containing protein [Stellaceae bacterium]|nr:adenylate/guanylate cyclase domain-containing protein [Stellaceae bacterium]